MQYTLSKNKKSMFCEMPVSANTGASGTGTPSCCDFIEKQLGLDLA